MQLALANLYRVDDTDQLSENHPQLERSTNQPTREFQKQTYKESSLQNRHMFPNILRENTTGSWFPKFTSSMGHGKPSSAASDTAQMAMILPLSLRTPIAWEPPRSLARSPARDCNAQRQAEDYQVLPSGDIRPPLGLAALPSALRGRHASLRLPSSACRFSCPARAERPS